MLSLEEAQSRAQDLVTAARKAGADAADAIYACNASTTVAVRLGALEDVERSEGEEIGLRVFIGQRSASISASDMNPATLATLIDRSIAMAREAPEDPYAGLAPEDRLLRKRAPSLDLVDEEEPEPAALRERALIAEEAARSIPGITNSEGGGAASGRSQVALATSHGFAGAYAATNHSTWASVLAGSGADMQRDHASHASRHLKDLDDAEAVGLRAGQRAVARLNPGKVDSGVMPVIFDPRIGSSLVGHLIGGMVGPAIARRSSFLLESLGETLFDSKITIIDDPLLLRGLRSRPFDGEGAATAARHIIENGTLATWLLDSRSARQLNLRTTGHAARGTNGPPQPSPSNLYLAPGQMSPRELMADIESGLYVTELIGMGVNGVTGDYSRGAAGFWIDKGEIAWPVSELTVAGNLTEMFAHLTAADDLTFRHGIDAPTLRVDGMTVAGQ